MAKSLDDRSPPTKGPFYRPLRVHDVPEKTGLDRRIEASVVECGAIAADCGLPNVGAVSADLHIRRHAGGRFTVSGSMKATITQICVVSLEPFEETLRQEVAVSFVLPASRHAGERERAVIVDVDDPDEPPDVIVDNTIDLGAVSLEFLTLARDFYPKRPGVHFTDVLIGEKDQPEPSTFAVLERLKDQS